MRGPVVVASVLATVAAAALVAAPRPADACSASCVRFGHFVPGDGATVPANLPAIYWRPRGDSSSPTPAMVTLTTAADPGTLLPFTATPAANNFDFLLTPDAPLVAGTQYILTDRNACDFGSTETGPRVTFTAGPDAPLPAALGSLAVTQLPVRTDTVASDGGGCDVQAAIASVAVSVDLATAELEPWRHVLHFETRVDGQVWSGRASILDSIAPGASWVGRGFDRLYSVCGVGNNLEQPEDIFPQVGRGAHQVQMRATLPGTTLAFATDSRTVTLECPAIPDGDAGLDSGSGAMGEGGGGCCSSSSSSSTSSMWLALGVLAILVRRRRAAMVALLGAIVIVATPRPADACSPPICVPGQFVPAEGATVPSNLPAIYWRASPNASPTASPSNVTLTTTADPTTPLSFTATQVADTFAYLLVPEAPLVEGATYVLTDATPCQFGTTTPMTATFAVGPSAPLPTTIGTLAVTDLPARTDTVASAGGSCSVDVVIVSAAVSVNTTASALLPWRDVLHFETRVDGQTWRGSSNILQSIPPGASWVGRGFDRIYAGCSESQFGGGADYGLAEGPHQVEMRATLPGTNLALATDTRRVTLTCPEMPDGDAGVDSGDGAMGEGGGGCCSTSTSSTASSAWLALAVLALVARRHRR